MGGISKFVRTSAGTMGFILGAGALLVGAALVVLAFSYRGGLEEAMSTVSNGLESARSAVASISMGASSSTSLVTQVRESLEASGEVLDETGSALESTGGSVSRLQTLSSTAAGELTTASERAAVVLGRNSLSGTISQLQQSSQTSRQLAARLDTLRQSVIYLRDEIFLVAQAVESLQNDMFSTEAAFGEAEGHLDRAASAAEKLSGSGALFWALVALGCVVFLTGVHLVLLSLSLFGMRQEVGQGGDE